MSYSSSFVCHHLSANTLMPNQYSSINFQSYRRGPLVPHNSEVLKLLREQEGTGGLRSAAMGGAQEPLKEPQRPRTSSQGPNTPSQGRHTPSQGQSATSQGPQGDTRGQNNSNYSPFCCTLLLSPTNPHFINQLFPSIQQKTMY